VAGDLRRFHLPDLGVGRWRVWHLSGHDSFGRRLQRLERKVRRRDADARQRAFEYVASHCIPPSAG